MADSEDQQTMMDDPTCRLMDAIFMGDLETTTNLLNSLSPSHWSTAWSEGYNLLCEALKHYQEDIAKLLLIRGAKVNNNNSEQFSEKPLHIAVSRGYIEIVDMLLERETNADAQDDSEDTPIHIAIENGNDEIFKSLLKKVTNLEVKSCGMTPLHIAANLGRYMMIEALLDRNANINSTCTSRWEYGYTPLHFAVTCRNEMTLMLLLTKGANPSIYDKDGLTPLHLAINKNRYKAAEILLEHGANVDSRDIVGNTILHTAVEKAPFEMVELVLAHSPDRKIKENRQCLYTAIDDRNEKRIVEALVRYGFTVNGDVDENRKLLHAAARNGYIEIVNDFLESKENVDIEQKDEKGVTLLHEAAKLQHVDIVNLLIEKNANVNAEDENGETPIHYAVANFGSILERIMTYAGTNRGETPLHAFTDKASMVKFLLDHGANVNATDKKNITPLHLCAMNFDNETMKILLAKGANINATSDDGNTPLHLAVENDDGKCVEFLVENGADIGYANKEGQNSLHIAARSYTMKVMNFLLHYFDGIDDRDKFGRTALHMASMNRDWRNITTLLNHNADVNIVCEAGYGPFDYISRGRVEHDSDDETPGDEDDFFLITEKLQRHIVKLITLGRYVSKRNLEIVQCYDSIFSETATRCKEQVNVMRKTKIGDSNINFYDLLTKDMNQLAINMRNTITVDTLITGDYKEKFDLYKEMIHNRFIKCLRRERLLDPSITFFSSLIGYNLNLFTIAELLSYLSNTDLESIMIAALDA